MEQVVIQFSADISKLLPAIEAFEKVGLIDKKNGDIFRTTSAEYSKRNQVLDQTITKNKELDKTISSGAVEAHTADIKENTKAIEQNTQGTVNLNRQLKEMQKELIAMEAAGQQNTQRFKELNKQAAELKDTIADAKERVKAFASDTRRLDAVVQSFKLVAASAAAMQGAFALFGSENAELQKTMMKLQGAMALLAGVQEIAAFATGQSYLKTVLLDGAQKLAAASAAAMGVSIGTASAILTGGVGIIIGAIAALVSYTNAQDDNTEALKRAQEENKKYQHTLIETEKSFKKSNASLKDEIKLLGLSGDAKEKATIELEAQNAKAEILSKLENMRALKAYEQWNELQKTKNKNSIEYLRQEGKLIAQGYKTGQQLAEGLVLIEEKKNAQLAALQREAAAAASEKAKAAAKERKDRETEAFNELKRKRQELAKELTEMPGIQDLPPVELEIKPTIPAPGLSAFVKAQIAAATEFGISQEQLMEEYYASGLENFEEFLKKKRELLQEQAQIEAQLQQTINQVVTEGANAALEIAKANMQAEYDARLDTLEKQKAAILENQNLTESQREATEKVFEDRRKKLMLQKWKAEQQIAISSAVINAALAVGNALATTKPFPAALIAAAGAAVSGAIQVAKIKSAPIPQFAEGTEFLEGAGTGTSDSIPAMLSRGERVVPAKTNKDYFDGLSVIQNRLVAPELVNSLLTNLAENGGMLAAPTEAITQLEQQFGIDYARLGKEFQKGRTQVSINIDEKGFTKHIQQGLNRSTYHNQKFRFKQ